METRVLRPDKIGEAPRPSFSSVPTQLKAKHSQSSLGSPRTVTFERGLGFVAVFRRNYVLTSFRSTLFSSAIKTVGLHRVEGVFTSTKSFSNMIWSNKEMQLDIDKLTKAMFCSQVGN